jgi:hypothetical protein
MALPALRYLIGDILYINVLLVSYRPIFAGTLPAGEKNAAMPGALPASFRFPRTADHSDFVYISLPDCVNRLHC